LVLAVRAGWGCLGFIIGIVCAGLAYFAFTFLNAGGQPPLVPASAVNDPDLTITVSQGYINDQLRAGMAARGLNGMDLSLQLHAPNRADASLTFPLTVLGETVDVSPQAALHFGVARGGVTVAVDGIDVGGVAVPQDLVQQRVALLEQYAQDQINATLKRQLTGTGLRLVGVQCTDSDLIVQLSR
jgi:hypothetical protein